MTSSERRPDVLVCGLGATTPIGRTALTSAAAARAGIAGFSEHPFMVDSEGQPMRVAQCPWLAAEPRIASRISDCLVAAIRESLEPLTGVTGSGRRSTTLAVNLPSARPGLPESLVQSVRAALEDAFKETFARVTVARLGHAGGVMAIQSATETAIADSGTACVVAGADSYIDPDTLEWLEDTEQLHGAGPRNNAWGFLPGEGAGSILLLPGELARRAKIKSLARVTGVGIGREANLIRTPTVCLGEGLTTAFRGALAALASDVKITDTYCDMNGEPYRADEFAFAVARTREHFVAATDFVAPADCWGDVGAASAPLFAVLACIAGLKSYSNGSTGLIWASSETGERGAAVIDTAARP